MTLILDYSFARPDPAGMKAAGYDGVMRYLSLDKTKNLAPTEAIGLRAAGLDIGLVWETTATRAGEGFSAGVVDATYAEAQATALGYPADAVIFYGVDYDAAPQAVAPYFAGVKTKARRPVGVYGSARIVEGVAAAYKWQACAWSAGKVSGQANLYQRLKATVAHPVAGTDENILLRAFPMWAAVAVPAHTDTSPSRGTVRPPLGADVGQVKAIQSACHIPADGKWGNQTSAAASAVINHTGDVRTLQGYVGTRVDGAWGPISEAARIGAVRAIQRAIGVVADGVWGPLSKAAWLAAYNRNYMKF